MFAQALYHGGGVEELMKNVSPSNKTAHDDARIAFDFLYFIVIIIIILNLVLGVIVDVCYLSFNINTSDF